MDNNEDQQQLKIVFIGDSSVGKTTIIQQYITRQFVPMSQPTIGSMFFTKELEVNGKDFKLQIWDTAG
jgi:Rab family protein